VIAVNTTLKLLLFLALLVAATIFTLFYSLATITVLGVRIPLIVVAILLTAVVGIWFEKEIKYLLLEVLE